MYSSPLQRDLTVQDPRNLVWVDLEMTGLDPDTDHIIEIASIVTDGNLNIIEEGPVLVDGLAEVPHLDEELGLLLAHGLHEGAEAFAGIVHHVLMDVGAHPEA